jgi:hypothetical protein
MSGWNLPPGVTTVMIEHAYGGPEGPCAVCGLVIDDCICPECPVCNGVGDPVCYDGGRRWYTEEIGGQRVDVERETPGHGLVRTAAQIEQRRKADEYLAEEAAADRQFNDDEFIWSVLERPPHSNAERDCLVGLAAAIQAWLVDQGIMRLVGPP